VVAAAVVAVAMAVAVERNSLVEAVLAVVANNKIVVVAVADYSRLPLFQY